jgi:hypothetical protein
MMTGRDGAVVGKKKKIKGRKMVRFFVVGNRGAVAAACGWDFGVEEARARKSRWTGKENRRLLGTVGQLGAGQWW